MPGYDRHAQRELADEVKAQARRLGFDACGISRAERLDEEAQRLEQWLLEGRHGSMDWMERNFEKRVDPAKLVDGAESVVTVIDNYFQDIEHSDDPETGKISRYAWGENYHRVLKDKLYLLFEWIDQRVNGIGGRVFVDSAPVMDKQWAKRSGLGWIGKHSNLLNQSKGSYFFIGELIIDLPLAPDSPVADHCGSCTRCIDACPTDAIYEPYAVDATKCISYLTIEHDGDDIPEELQPDMGNWIFGCDICQQVCPWNKFKKPTDEENYEPKEGMRETAIREWMELDVEAFRERFKDHPIGRTGYDNFRRNLRIAAENAATESG